MVSAAFHIHSNWSYDGQWTLPELARAFSRRGYRILMVADHDRGFTEARRRQHRDACAQASSESILLIPGIEYSDAQNTVHVLVWGSVPFLGEGLSTLELLKAARAAGGLAVLAHPSRRQAWRVFDPAWSEYLLGIEVWNRKADGWAPSTAAQRLLEGTSLIPFVSLDFHAKNQMFPLSMALEISSTISEASILECLRGGACHAMAFSRPAREVLGGWPGFALQPAERLRRKGALAYRWLRGMAHPSSRRNPD